MTPALREEQKGLRDLEKNLVAERRPLTEKIKELEQQLEELKHGPLKNSRVHDPRPLQTPLSEKDFNVPVNSHEESEQGQAEIEHHDDENTPLILSPGAPQAEQASTPSLPCDDGDKLLPEADSGFPSDDFDDMGFDDLDFDDMNFCNDGVDLPAGFDMPWQCDPECEAILNTFLDRFPDESLLNGREGALMAGEARWRQSQPQGLFQWDSGIFRLFRWDSFPIPIGLAAAPRVPATRSSAGESLRGAALGFVDALGSSGSAKGDDISRQGRLEMERGMSNMRGSKASSVGPSATSTTSSAYPQSAQIGATGAQPYAAPGQNAPPVSASAGYPADKPQQGYGMGNQNPAAGPPATYPGPNHHRDDAISGAPQPPLQQGANMGPGRGPMEATYRQADPKQGNPHQVTI
ncbi:hypothetical protein CVT26_003259 [Gymnopilus dilepis]|uniref:Uncharacterized protein n=1 Tax=Gymnopilus dilepis TaxID=231916 RepID=A0A409Y529_9AGAR|nr:hypothetical protein CVT26_003259 [Gymnopilus dilepis]